MKSVFTTLNPIKLISKFNELLGSTNTHYTNGPQKSEKPDLITNADKVRLKCDCADGSIVFGIR